MKKNKKKNSELCFAKLSIDFTKVGDIDFGDTSHGDLDKALSFTPTKARYVKLIVTESNRYPYANIAVFKVYPKE